MLKSCASKQLVMVSFLGVYPRGKSLYRKTVYTANRHSVLVLFTIQLDSNLLSQDVWMLKILKSILYRNYNCNNFNLIST